jgi:hypothetical protein
MMATSFTSSLDQEFAPLTAAQRLAHLRTPNLPTRQ